MTLRAALALLMLLGLSTCASAQLAVSSNDTKVVNVDGVNQIVQNPPQSVAIALDESIALVAASTKIDPAVPRRLLPTTG
jgi:Skp family chaperone for outer membrane proteins